MGTRPDRKDPLTLSDLSLAVHAGNQLDSTMALRTPLVMANSYQLPDDPSEISWSATAPGLYTRNTGVNQSALEQKLAALDGAEEAVALASGVAALHAVFFTHMRVGDHVIVSDVVYEATWRLWTELLPQRYGLEATFVDIGDLDAVRAAMRPETRLVCIEAIANPTTKVADVAAIAEIAHSAGAILMVDSTFSPPPFYRPIQDGADLVVHSLTKYLNGHGDAMGGSVAGSHELIQPIKADAMVDVGASSRPSTPGRSSAAPSRSPCGCGSTSTRPPASPRCSPPTTGWSTSPTPVSTPTPTTRSPSASSMDAASAA